VPLGYQNEYANLPSNPFEQLHPAQAGETHRTEDNVESEALHHVRGVLGADDWNNAVAASGNDSDKLSLCDGVGFDDESGQGARRPSGKKFLSRRQGCL